MVLNVVARPGDAFAAMRHLLTDNHEARPAQRRHIRRAIAIYRALLAAGVIERLDEPDADGRRVRLTVDLQVDFALNQPLSPFAVEALTSSTGIHRPTPSTSCRSSRPPSTTPARSSPPSNTRPGARPSAR